MKIVKTISVLFLLMTKITLYSQVYEYKVERVEHYIVNEEGKKEKISVEYPSDFIVVWYRDAMIFKQNKANIREFYYRTDRYSLKDDSSQKIEEVVSAKMENKNGKWSLAIHNGKPVIQKDLGGVIIYKIGDNYLEFNYDPDGKRFRKYDRYTFFRQIVKDDKLQGVFE